MNDFFLAENTDFIPFSLQHLFVVLFWIGLGVIVILWARKQSEKTQIYFGNLYAVCISLAVIIERCIRLYLGDFDVKSDLPLHLCTFLAFIIPIFSFTRKYLYFEIIFFMILTGTFQSLVTPSNYNFLNFQFLRYWVVHAGLVMFMMYAVFVYRMRPTFKSIWKSFIGLQIYFVSVLLINYLLGSNYFYLSKKPDAASMLDLMGDWPYYILVAELIVIPYFLLIYLPFHLTRKKVKV